MKGLIKVGIGQVFQIAATACAAGIYCLPGGAQGFANEAVEVLGTIIFAATVSIESFSSDAGAPTANLQRRVS